MNLFRRPRPFITDPIPPDRIPPGHVVQSPPVILLLEAEARLAHAAELIEQHLKAQAALDEDDRNGELEDVLLDLHATVRPSAVDPADMPGLAPVRAAVPVIPGRPV